MLIGERIGKLRTEKNMRATALARMVGVEQSYISQIEHGKKNPSLAVLQKIADALDVELPTLFEGSSLTGMLSPKEEKLLRLAMELSEPHLDLLISTATALRSSHSTAETLYAPASPSYYHVHEKEKPYNCRKDCKNELS